MRRCGPRHEADACRLIDTRLCGGAKVAERLADLWHLNTPQQTLGSASYPGPISRVEEALAFDDVLVVPAYSQVVPSLTSTATRLTREITLNIPLISAAMDTVTEAEMAITMAQLGGMGVIHKNMSPEEQAAQVRRVKKFESGMVVNPLTIHPDQTLADVKLLMTTQRISGIPVVERETNRLVGIVTNRDVRFATEPTLKVYELMTRENLVTVNRGRGCGSCTATAAQAPDREADRGRRRLSLHRPDYGQGYGQSRVASAGEQG